MLVGQRSAFAGTGWHPHKHSRGSLTIWTLKKIGPTPTLITQTHHLSGNEGKIKFCIGMEV